MSRLTLIFTIYEIWVSKSQLLWASVSLANTYFLVLLWWTFSGHPTSISPFFWDGSLISFLWFTLPPQWDYLSFKMSCDSLTKGWACHSSKLIKVSLVLYFPKIIQKGERMLLISGSYWRWFPEVTSISFCCLDFWSRPCSCLLPDEQMFLLQSSHQVIELFRIFLFQFSA